MSVLCEAGFPDLESVGVGLVMHILSLGGSARFVAALVGGGEGVQLTALQELLGKGDACLGSFFEGWGRRR